MVCARRACFSSVSVRTQTLRKRGRIQSKLRRTALCYSDQGGGWMQHHMGGGCARGVAGKRSPLGAAFQNSNVHYGAYAEVQECTVSF